MDVLARTLKRMPPSDLTHFMTDTLDNCHEACDSALVIVNDLLDFESEC